MLPVVVHDYWRLRRLFHQLWRPIVVPFLKTAGAAAHCVGRLLISILIRRLKKVVLHLVRLASLGLNNELRRQNQIVTCLYCSVLLILVLVLTIIIIIQKQLFFSWPPNHHFFKLHSFQRLPKSLRSRGVKFTVHVLVLSIIESLIPFLIHRALTRHHPNFQIIQISQNFRLTTFLRRAVSNWNHKTWPYFLRLHQLRHGMLLNSHFWPRSLLLFSTIRFVVQTYHHLLVLILR